MAIIRGHRESKGATAAELNPLDAEILSTLRQQLREFRKNKPTPVAVDTKPLTKQIDRLAQSLSKKVGVLDREVQGVLTQK